MGHDGRPPRLPLVANETISPTSPIQQSIGTHPDRGAPVTDTTTVYGASALVSRHLDIAIVPSRNAVPRSTRCATPRNMGNGSLRRISSAGNATYHSQLMEVCPAPAVSQVRQMRDGFSLGLQGLARYSSWFNVLLVFVPFGVFAHIFELGEVVVFVSCFIGMMPLAMHLSQATEDIADRTNYVFGALVNVTFGNAVEIILSLSALRAGRLTLVRNTLAGSILSNLLLVLGSAFLWGGLKHSEQTVSLAVSESNADMLAFSVFSLSIPALFSMTFPDSPKRTLVEEKLSLVTSVCLLLLYCLFMFFQLHTHEYLYSESGDIESGTNSAQPLIWRGTSTVDEVEDNVEAGEDAAEEEEEEEEEGEDDVPSLQFSAMVLIVTVVAVAGLSELLVGSIGGFSANAGLGEKFIAIVLLPVIGNAVEHMSAILVAGHNKIDLSIGIACGSSVQIALFAAPMLVLISWALDWKRLTLNFHLFDTMCIGFSVFVVNVMLRDSNSNWLKGMVLIGCYFIVAAAFFYVT